ncbi:MAG: hypothetical protein COB02_05385 [Candidatus Cloacimonadota bacterium]|nr:MAG: hypothetical protein COB02_05385 [Candidatus Cloacimonadota bacterium]
MCFEKSGEIHIEIAGVDDCSSENHEDISFQDCNDCEDTLINGIDDFRFDILSLVFVKSINLVVFNFKSFQKKEIRLKLAKLKARAPTVTHLKTIILRV